MNLISGRMVMSSLANSMSTRCFSHNTHFPDERFCKYPSTSPRIAEITILRSKCDSLRNTAVIESALIAFS